MSLSRTLMALVALIIVSTGCKRKQGDIDGIGPYRLGHTTEKDKPVGRCTERDDFLYCSNNAGVSIAGQPGEVHLYMRAKEGDVATATEIMVVVRRCNRQVIEAVEAALRKELGEASGQVGGRLVWTNKRASIIAQLPAEGDTCEINFLHPSEKERIAKLSPPVAPAKPAPAPAPE